MLRPIVIASISVVLFTTGRAEAQNTYIWTNSATNWDTTSASWTGAGTVWANPLSPPDIATFSGATSTLTVNVANGINVGQITESNGTAGNFILSGGSINLLLGGTITTPTINVNRGNGSLEIDSVLQGTSGFTKAGAGDLYLGGANTVSGTANITSGSLYIENSLAAQNLTVSTTVTVHLETNATFGGLSGSGNLDLAGGGTHFNLSVGNNNANTSYSGIISAAHGNLTKIGTGTLDLSGANTYGGGTTVTSGVLTFLNTAAQPSTGTVSVGPGATLGLGVSTASGFFTSANVDSLFANTLTHVSLNATSNVGIDSTAGNFTYASSVASNTHGLNILGPNIVTLTSVSHYTGGTTVTTGTLQLGVANAVPSVGGLTLAGGTLSTGATTGFSDSLGALTVSSASTIGLGTGTHQLTFTTLSGSGPLTVTGWAGTPGAPSTTGTGELLFSGLGSSAMSANTTYAGFLNTTSFGSTPGAEFVVNGSNLELVPLPSTSTPEPGFILVVAGAALLGGSLFGKKRAKSSLSSAAPTL